MGKKAIKATSVHKECLTQPLHASQTAAHPAADGGEQEADCLLPCSSSTLGLVGNLG